MCGTFSQSNNGRIIVDEWTQRDSAELRRKPLKVKLDEKPYDNQDLLDKYPGQEAMVVLNTKLDEVRLQKAKWGLIPTWAKSSIEFKAKCFNARAETIAELPSFKESYQKWRCLVPCKGYWEFKQEEGSLQKKRYLISNKHEIMWLTGVFSVRRQDEQPLSFSIVTQEPKARLAEIHQRKPMILKDLNECVNWLEGKGCETLDVCDEEGLEITLNDRKSSKNNDQLEFFN
jgi:putative SOS response-associated peptidase YedK